MKTWIAIAALSLTAPLAIAQVGPVDGRAAPQTVQAAGPFTNPATVPADLARVDAALNNTDSFQGRFIQIDPNGVRTSGEIFLQRPGKLRFEYDAPSPMLVVSDGVTVTQHDKALETWDRVPLSATPLNYFLKENVNLANDTEVVGLLKLPTQWRVSARDGSGEMDGIITMVFDPTTLALKEWMITDSFGGQTRVMLSDLRYNQRVDPRKFILRDDSNRRDRRR